MDKSKHKSGRKLEKNNAKEKSPQFFSDVKSLKENLKIKEILRTVKMNSSMRIKAPPGSKVMNSKDFNDNEDYFEESVSNEFQDQVFLEKSPSATNLNVVSSLTLDDIATENNNDVQTDQSNENINDFLEISNEKEEDVDLNITLENSIGTELHQFEQNSQTETDTKVSGIAANQGTEDKITTGISRDRKLSLDQTFLSRRTGLSQSELDLHLIGKSPLERKSSFFRKKMDSFLKNTTEIFKKQSQSGKSQHIQRRGSMSISLQSLSDKSSYNNGQLNDNPLHNEQELRNSTTSLSTMARSSSIASSISMSPCEQLDTSSPIDSRSILFASQPLEACASNSVNNLNEALDQESFLKSRAISMSSGLDAPPGRPRRKASKSNRVTWLASEGLTNYFKRVIQDEKSREKICHSYQDFSSIPEDELYKSTKDSKGRRLSYQRAVSGEDPVQLSKHYESTQRRKNFIREQQTTNPGLIRKLEEYAKHGVPPLRGYEGAVISNQSLGYLMWVVQESEQLQFHVSTWKMSQKEELKQAVICELIKTEADYIFHLIRVVELFIAAAHDLQGNGFLLDIETERLFTNLPDVLAANLYFWTNTFFPMLNECLEHRTPFRVDQMVQGFAYFKEHFRPYVKYVYGQNKNLDYLRSISNNQDFTTFLSWCSSHMDGHRLQLIDIMVKPMQRLTKYPLILQRILDCTELTHERNMLEIMIKNAKSFVVDINRIIRQRDELEKLDVLDKTIETFDICFREDEMYKCFKIHAQLNLKAPMHNCAPGHNRCVIFEGDYRFKDTSKEVEVKIFIITDILLVCKKVSKGGNTSYKMIRPKYMVDKLHAYPRVKNNLKDLESIVLVVVDEVGSSHNCFTLFESSKEEKNQGQLKTSTLNLFASKLKEAKICYELAIWYTKNPFRDLSEIDLDLNVLLDAAAKTKMHHITTDEVTIEKEARETLATMLHGIINRRRSEDSRITCPFNSFDITHAILAGDLDTIRNIRLYTHRISICESTRTSRLSSFHKSTSATSYDEPHPGPSRIYRPSSSIEHVPVQLPEEDTDVLDESKDIANPTTVQQPKVDRDVIQKTDMQQPVLQGTVKLAEDQSETSTNLNQHSATRQPKFQQTLVEQPIFQSLTQQPMLRPQIKHPLKILPPVKPIPLDEECIMQTPETFTIPTPIRVLPSLHRGIPTLTALVLRTDEIKNSIQGEKIGQSDQRAQSAQSSRGSHSAQSSITTQSDQSDHNTQSVQDLSTSSSQTNQSLQMIQKHKSDHIRTVKRGVHGRRATSASPSTLRTQPRSSDRFMHSLPDLTIEPATPRFLSSFSTDSQTASEKLYQAHNERLQKLKRPAGQQQQQQYLSPVDHTSYPPSSPTRASLTRGMAFSYSLEYSPLHKMGHAKSQTNLSPQVTASTTRYSKSGSTSPVPEPSPERRAKSATGSRRNRSRTTTDNQGARNTQTSQETEEQSSGELESTTASSDSMARTDTTALTDTPGDTDETAPAPNNDEASPKANIFKDGEDVKTLEEDEALKGSKTYKGTQTIKVQETANVTKACEETEAFGDIEFAEYAVAPRAAEAPDGLKDPEGPEDPKDHGTLEDPEAQEAIDASGDLGASKDSVAPEDPEYVEKPKPPKDSEPPEDPAAADDSKAPEDPGAPENLEVCGYSKDSEASKDSEVPEFSVNMVEVKPTDKEVSEDSEAANDNKISKNAEGLEEANDCKDTKTPENLKPVKDSRGYEEAKESNGAKDIEDTKDLNGDKKTGISQTYTKSYTDAPQDENQRPPDETGNQNNSGNIGPYDDALMTQQTPPDGGIDEDLEFFEQVPPENQSEDDQEA